MRSFGRKRFLLLFHKGLELLVYRLTVLMVSTMELRSLGNSFHDNARGALYRLPSD
jgi:hypothetical protein